MKRMDLETKRLRIGEWTPELAEALFYLSQDESNQRFLPDEAFDTIAQAQAAIAEYIVNRHAGTGTQSCPVFRKGGTCIGHVALCPMEDWDEEAWEIECHCGASEKPCVARLSLHGALTAPSAQARRESLDKVADATLSTA